MSHDGDFDAVGKAFGCDEAFDRLLIEEGLDLLATFRLIKDPDERRRLRDLVLQSVEAQERTPSP